MDSLVTPYPLPRYLENSRFINWERSRVRTQAALLAAGASSECQAIQATFEWVRDSVSHSCDIQSTRVTARATEVLQYREGICYGKSHLLAALLRAQGIPSGLCYQRLLQTDDPSDGYVVHALNTVWPVSIGRWIRLDARGNRPGVDAQFSIDEEQLAFPVRPELGEVDYRVNLPAPHPAIVATLRAHADAMVM